MKLRCLKVCFLALGALLPHTLSACSFPDSFDPYLQDASERYLPEYHWLYFKAQAYQESLLDPNAVSHAGAMGLLQVMPGTWREQTALMGINASPYNPKASALVGAAYMRRMIKGWKAPRPPDEVLRWSWSSYNWGMGNVLKAQKKADGSAVWADIKPYLPNETRAYVTRIERWHGEMQACDGAS